MDLLRNEFEVGDFVTIDIAGSLVEAVVRRVEVDKLWIHIYESPANIHWAGELYSADPHICVLIPNYPQARII